MTYTLIVLDRGRPIAKHTGLDSETGQELAAAYRAIGWPEDKIKLEAETAQYQEARAAA